MSYYEDVYLQRVNRNGTSRQERILNTKIQNFENFLPKSMYKVDFSYNYQNYIGSLQPAKGDEKDIVSYMLTSKTVDIATGEFLQSAFTVDALCIEIDLCVPVVVDVGFIVRNPMFVERLLDATPIMCVDGLFDDAYGESYTM